MCVLFVCTKNKILFSKCVENGCKGPTRGKKVPFLMGVSDRKLTTSLGRIDYGMDLAGYVAVSQDFGQHKGFNRARTDYAGMVRPAAVALRPFRGVFAVVSAYRRVH